MRRMLIGLSLSLNILALGMVLYLWFGTPFRDWVHPFLTNAAVSFFESYPVADGDILFIGDSITQGARWNEMFAGLPVRNRGISGDRTDDILRRIDHLTAAPARKVFLKIGTNDIGTGVEESKTLTNYATILDTLQRELPETKVYVQSILPREAENRARVERLNREIAAMAAQRGLTFIDLYPAFLAEDGSIRDELTYDELHLSGEGYRVWQRELEPFVRG